MYPTRFGLGQANRVTSQAPDETVRHDSEGRPLLSGPGRSPGETRSVERALTVVGVFLVVAMLLLFVVAALGN